LSSQMQRLTAIERLEKKRPGIVQDVNDHFLEGMTGEEMLKYLFETYGIDDIPLSTIYYHRLTRTVAWKQEIRERKAAYAAMAELVDEKGLDDAAKSQLWEICQQMTPAQLLVMRRVETDRQRLALDTEKLALDKQRVENEKQDLQLRIDRAKKAFEEASGEAEQKLGKGESLTLDDINRIRERTFGLPEIAPSHPA
jgi:hypothetical protein